MAPDGLWGGLIHLNVWATISPSQVHRYSVIILYWNFLPPIQQYVSCHSLAVFLTLPPCHYISIIILQFQGCIYNLYAVCIDRKEKLCVGLSSSKALKKK